MTEAHPKNGVEVYSEQFLDHMRQHAADFYPILMKKSPGCYHGRVECCKIYWRAKRTDHGPCRLKSLTVTFIDINLPGGQMLFGW
jgi:hypothetical protein